MGSVQSIEVEAKMIPVTNKGSNGESPVYRNMHCFAENGGKLITSLRNQPESRTIIDLMRTSSVKWGTNDCMGERSVNPDGSAGPYVWLSYKEVYERCLQFGRGLLELGLKRGDKIGVYGGNSQWWQIIAHGAYSVGLVIVPVYDSLGKDAAEYIINHAEVKVVFCSEVKYENTVNIANLIKENCSTICVIGESVPEALECPIPTMTCNGVLEKGENSERGNEFPQPGDTAVIMYTSGSTGTPKGCVLSHGGLVAGATGLGVINMSVGPSDTFLSFLPLAHVYALAVETMMYGCGARVGFVRGGVENLIPDIEALQPTIMVAVPRVLNKVASSMKSKISDLSPLLQRVVGKAIAMKSAAVRQNRPHSLLLDAILFGKFRAVLGGRLRLVVNGGAPLLPEVFDFLAATITPCIIQGYGLTETCAGAAVQEQPISDPSTVGAISVACEAKLRRVEGADYDPNGEIARGELLIKGPILFDAYYKQPDLTDDVMLDGWFATGDVVEITKEGQLRIIDRAKQLVKMSQGEYISITSLTEAYSTAEHVSFIYVHVDPSKDFPVAVVVPKAQQIKMWNENGVRDISTSDAVKKEIIESLQVVFEKRQLRGFERIKHVIVDTEEPTTENGLLTPSMKPKFEALKKKYIEQLDQLYAGIGASH